MVELVESADARRERKRLKKMKKLQNASVASASDDSPLSSDVDSTTKILAALETPEEKKERKRLKKLAKKKIEEAAVAMADVVPTPSSETLEEKKERKRLKKLAKKKIEEAAAAMGVMVPPQTKGEVKNEGKKKNSKKDINSNNPEKVKTGKKRKNEDCANNENAIPTTAWAKVMQKTAEPPSKKQKQKTLKVKVEIPEEKETGVFKKIFYKATETTLTMADEEVAKFRADNKMNVTGENIDNYKPILNFKDFCEDPAIMSVCKVVLKIHIYNIIDLDTIYIFKGF